MATLRWLARAVNIANKHTITIANTWATNDTATITINGNDLTITVGSLTTTAQVATSLKQAFEGEAFTDTTASVSPTAGKSALTEHSKLTATVSGSVVTLTANTPGVPWTITASESTAGDGTATAAESVAATGKHFWSNADNWSSGSVPVSSDDVFIDIPVDIIYGLDQNTVDLTSLEIRPAFGTAKIGLPYQNPDGYTEFRDRSLKIGSTTTIIDCASPHLRIDFDSTATTCVVRNTGMVPSEPNTQALRFRGTSTTSVFVIEKGHVGFGMIQGETARFATLHVGLRTLSTDAQVWIGPAVTTATTINQLSGSVTITHGATTTTYNLYGGVVYMETPTITTLLVESGSCYYNSTATITTLTVAPTGTIVFASDGRARTVTNANFYDGYNVDDPMRTVTWTNTPSRFETYPYAAHP